MARRFFYVCLGILPLPWAFSCLLPTAVLSEEPALPKFETKVMVFVTADADIKDEITSYLKGSLRSLGDVDVVDYRTVGDQPIWTDHDWEIHVVALQTENVGGVKTGVALSVVMLRSISPLLFTDIVDRLEQYALRHGYKEPTNDYREFAIAKGDLGDYAEHLITYWDQTVQTCSRDQLRSTCESIIAAFDTQSLEKDRQAYQQALDKLRGTGK